MENGEAIKSELESLPWDLPGLERDAEGIWVPRDRTGRESVSYPDEGNDLCFRIEDDSFWFAHRNQLLAELLRCFPPKGPILDVGGGNGFVTRGLTESGFPTVLLEPGYRGCLNARNRGLQSVICSTVEKVGFSEGDVAAFGLFDVLEHIEDDVGMLQYLKEIAAPEGRLYLTVPALPFLWSEDDVVGGHHRRYTLKSLRQTLEKAGWSWREGGYCFTYAVLPVILRRLLNFFKVKDQDVNEAAVNDHQLSSGVIADTAIKAGNSFDAFSFFSMGGWLPGSSIAMVAERREE